ncbi:DNA gyrase inhibitor YacG [Aestuariirhabdus litorea]|uniref:DNA gyrase inhibitor YacG n=1 Tax=Aestuariirhabdus litorea TaxID=2528527 RepID=A0A3P3VSY6_9GAMM|nr:DNA gyrase inhibitor YacG [Aestuariirhabdus litorea]RRJ83883.1 DNA gyrase inhibitor YacG [Aestuariirhabdus litorea]RWW97105.1 DNA gyrase inhibitor YacG [Endozoicomonadaceae bacterium GTF-13]
MTLNCPHCQKQVEWSPQNPYRPFCSERCKLIDFGSWANEDNRIAGDPEFDDLLSGELNGDNVYPFPGQ